MEENCKISRWDILKSQLNNLGPEAFQNQWFRADNPVLLDVRKKEEFATGSLLGAVNIDYLSENFLDELELLDLEKTYFVFCRSGRRSIRTCTLMENSGFKKIFNLDGGLNEWQHHFGNLNVE